MTDATELVRFSARWATALAAELEASEAYRTAAESWEGALVLELSDGDGAAVFLDLHCGRCRAAAEATPERRELAAYVLRAGRPVWERILAGELDPIWALLSGQLALDKGSIGKLAPFPEAARELVAAARRTGGRWPAEAAR